MSYFIYILQSQTADRYYTGSSDNPTRRLGFHNSIEKGFTSRYRSWNIVFTKRFDTKMEALAAERKIKKWKSKIMIERVISGQVEI